jgi:phosphotriesterase-related protein
MLAQSTRAVVSVTACGTAPQFASAKESPASPTVRTVLGPVSPEKLGATLMHEHAPVVDRSQLFGTPPAPIEPVREKFIAESARLLDAFHNTLSADERPGAIVETTPIRVGRYPQILVELARRTKVHVIASSGFWCEAVAPQHPWAVELGMTEAGRDRMAALFVREITTGMEDPSAAWGERFTTIKAGIIKLGTSTVMRPSEKVCHIAAAIASKETGCPITTHTTRGGGLEEAELLLKHGAAPERIIIGHQGHQDDREHDEATDYHRQIARLGCYVQFDRVGHGQYAVDKQARQIVRLIEAGFVKQVLVSHDNAPFSFSKDKEVTKRVEDWKTHPTDYTTVTTKLVEALRQLSVSKADLRTILVDNPRRALAF